MRVFFLASLLALYGYCRAQSDTILYFSWNDANRPPTFSDIGPDGVSVSDQANVRAGGVNGTNGLSAFSTAKADIEMSIENDPVLNTPGMDISYFFNQAENEATILDRGNWFQLGTATTLSVSFRLDNGDGTFEQVSFGNFDFARDGSFEKASFRYDPNTGEGTLQLDDETPATYTDPAARPMYWDGAPGFHIGRLLDASGGGDPTLDELIIREVALANSLPIELLNFEAHARPDGTAVELRWEVASETDNEHFDIERSVDSGTWQNVLRVAGRGTANTHHTYTATDAAPPAGRVFYRLRQTDYDGTTSHSPVRSALIPTTGGSRLFPNPATGNTVTLTAPSGVDARDISVYTGGGARVQGVSVDQRNTGTYQLNVTELPAGLYIVKVGTEALRLVLR